MKQDELSRLNRDNERLLSDSRQQTKVMATRDDTIARPTGELNALAIGSAREEGAKEQLIDQLAYSRGLLATLRDFVTQAETRATHAQALLETTQHEVDLLRQKLKQLQHAKNPSGNERADDQRQE